MGTKGQHATPRPPKPLILYIQYLILSKLGVKLWSTKALDKEEWASIIREAKARLKGP